MLSKPWRDVGDWTGVWGQLGVYELADAEQRVVFVGMAGGRSRFGLRGELIEAAARHDAICYRCEITSAYLTRYRELLMRHVRDSGAVPLHAPVLTLGRLG